MDIEESVLVPSAIYGHPVECQEFAPSGKNIQPSEPKEFRLYRSYHGYSVMKPGNEKENNLHDDTIALCDKVHESIRANYFEAGQAPEHVGMKINFTTRIISYKVEKSIPGVNDGKPVPRFKHLSLRNLSKKAESKNDEGLKQLVKDINIISKRLHSEQDRYEEGVASNRPHKADKPLYIPNQWPIALHRISAEDYSSKVLPGFDLEENDLEYAKNNIKESEEFKEDLLEKIEEQLKAQTEILETLRKEEPHLGLHIEELEKRIRYLQSLKDSLDNLDTFAVFTAVIFANQTLLSFNIDGDRCSKANLARKFALAHLQTQNYGKDPYTGIYADEVGDLLFHDHGLYAERVEGRGADKKGTSMEEFIVYNMHNLLDDAIIPSALESLEIPGYDQKLQSLITESLTTVRKGIREEDNLLSAKASPEPEEISVEASLKPEQLQGKPDQPLDQDRDLSQDEPSIAVPVVDYDSYNPKPEQLPEDPSAEQLSLNGPKYRLSLQERAVKLDKKDEDFLSKLDYNQDDASFAQDLYNAGISLAASEVAYDKRNQVQKDSALHVRRNFPSRGQQDLSSSDLMIKEGLYQRLSQPDLASPPIPPQKKRWTFF